MKFLAIAFSITLLSSLTIYSFLKFVLSVEGEAAFSVAAFPYLASGHIYEMLERKSAKTLLETGSSGDLLDFKHFGLKSYQFFIFSILLFYGSLSIVGGIVGMLTALSGMHIDIGEFGIITLPSSAIITFLVGRWLGGRYRHRALGMLLLCLAIAICMTFDKIVVYVISQLDEDDDFFSALKDMPIADIARFTAIGIAFYCIIGCLALWIGARQRSIRYLSYLLKIMPPNSRTALMGLALDEAKSGAAPLRPRHT
jgi:hypothetical protein